MDSTQVKTFCDTAAQLLTLVGDYASAEVSQRKPADDAMMRQLRISVGALANALNNVARMIPPPMPVPPSPAQVR
jgi:hypothetical protein